jgi:hypothetical protein
MAKCNKIIFVCVIIFPLLINLSFSAEPTKGQGSGGYIQKNDAVEEQANKPVIDLKLPKFSLHGPQEYIPLVDIQAYGSYNYADKSGSLWGGSVYGSASPAMKYDDKLYIIPLYSGSYDRQKFFVKTEEGGRSYNEIQHHDLSVTAKYLFDERATISPTIFGGWDLNVETNDEEWGNGLYDYRELGSGCNFDYLVYNTQKGQVKLNNGVKWYIRQYPNYHSLIALATTTAPERDEKDYNGVELSAGWQYANLKTMSLKLKYTALMKFYTDKKIINADGILQDDKREEYRNSVKFEGTYSPMPKKGLQLDCASEVAYNNSDQNFYDSRGTATLSDDMYTPHYYDYLSFEVNPRLSYYFTVGEKVFAILGGGYDFLMRCYTDRKAQYGGGGYSSDDEIDYEHIFSANLEIPFGEHISWITKYDYTIDRSNMDFEQYYTYSYKMHRVLTGISISY